MGRRSAGDRHSKTPIVGGGCRGQKGVAILRSSDAVVEAAHPLPETAMIRIVCHVALLALALSLATCKQPTGPSEKAASAKNEKPAAPAEGKPQEPIDALKALGGAVRFDGEGNVIVVQIRDGKATDATAKLLVAMESLKDLQLSGEKVTDAKS